MTSLGVSIEHAMQQKRLRDERRRVDISLNLFRTLLDRSNDGIEVIDPETGCFLDVNDTTCQCLGYTREEMLALRVPDIDASVVTFASWEQIVDEIHRNGSKIFESGHRRKDGFVFPVEINVRWVKLDRDYMIATVRDITERKKLEAEVTMREQRLNAFFTSAPAGLVLLDRELRFIQINETVAKVNGVFLEDHLGKTVREILPKLASVVEPLLQKVLATGEPILNIEVSGETPSQPGVTRHWLESFFPIIGKNGSPEGIGVILVEVSERRQAENSLRLLNSAVMQAKEAVVITDAQLDLPGPHIIFVNPAFTQITGYAAAEAIGKTPRLLQGPRTEKNLLRRLRQNLEQGEVFEGEAIQYRKDGTEYIQAWQIAPVRDEFGNITHYVSIQRDITNRKRIEKALRESEEKFSQLFRSSPIAMALSTIDEGRYLDVNEEFLRILQRSREEVVGHTAAELGVWNKPGQRTALMARFKELGALRNVELEIRGKAGQVTPILWSLESVVIGDEWCFLGSSLDISERKRAEAALRESEEKFRKIFENVKDVFYQTDDAGKIIEISPSIERYSGYRREELIGQPVDMVYYNQADRVTLLNILSEKGEVVDYEIQLKTKSGRVVFTSVNAHILFGSDGKPAGVEGALRDITARKQAEQELQWKTALLEAQMESALDGILVVTNQGRQILQNQRMIDLWKFPPYIAAKDDDAAQLEFASTLLKNPDQFAAKITYLNSHPEEISRDEIELVDGTILDRYSSPVRDKAGRHFGRIWTFRDITEQRKLEAQLRQSQKMEAFGQLAGGVAHDFNNLLAVIQLQAGLLQAEKSLSLEQLDLAGGIEKAAQRGANLTRQLLLFSRQQAMQPRKLKLKDAVDNITKMLQRTLGEQVQLQFMCSEENLTIHADPGMIDQILLNLTVNARDAMPKGGRIIIKTSAVEFDEVSVTQFDQARPGSFACLSVADTGCGIPPEVLPRIFEPFFTTKEVGKGTGLGLATVFGIVQQHKGWIHVYSELNQGTTFRVYLPRLNEHSDTKLLRTSLPAERGGNETILLVEDELALRTSLRTTLTRLGYRVLEASTGDDALDVWQQHRDEIHLLLTDMVMPGSTTGKELADRLLEQNPRLKVIYTSGYSAEIADKELTLEEGVNFLTKPFVVHQLAQTIRKRLDQN